MIELHLDSRRKIKAVVGLTPSNHKMTVHKIPAASKDFPKTKNIAHWRTNQNQAYLIHFKSNIFFSRLLWVLEKSTDVDTKKVADGAREQN